MGLMDLFRDGGLLKRATTPQIISDAMVVQGMSNDGSMGPGAPTAPGRGYSVRPRATDYPAGVNINVQSRRAWGRTGYDVLRELMRSYDIAQMCKNHKIDELRSMEPMFTPMDGFKGDGEAAVAAARAALSFPDREHSWDEWLSLWLDNLLTFDSGPLYRRRNRDGQIIALEVVDGSTIYPLVDGHGRRPQAPAPAYQQVIKGQSSVDFTAEDLTYARFRPQTDSPFGMAPLESIMMTVNTDMRFQWHLLQMFTEGSIPGGFMELPPDVSSPDQVAEWQDYWDATFMGDQAIAHKLIAVPGGSKFTATAPASFDPEFPKYLAIKVAAAFGVIPQDLGLTDDVNRATGETQTDTQFRVNTLPWVRFVEAIVTRYLQHDLGLPVQLKLKTGRDEEDRLTEAQAWKVYIESGMASADEGREQILGLPVDNTRPVPRGMILPRQGFVPLSSLVAVSGTVDPETKAPAEGTPVQEVLIDGVNGAQPQAPAVMKELTAGVTSATGITGIDMVGDDELEKSGPTVAGAAVKAADTGRVLMIQRCLDPEDPAAGTWEFPGGHLNTGEDAQAAAIREWEEETGLDFPADAKLAGTWDSPDGAYQGHVYKIATEGSVPINTGDGEDGETLAWFDPAHLDGFPALREELAANLPSDELAKAAARELAKFRTFTKARAKTGKWRDFEFTAIPEPVAKHLNDQARADFAKEEPGSDASPKAGTPSWRDDPPVTAAIHTVDLALTDYWSPRIRDSLLEMWKASDYRAAITAVNGIGDKGMDVFRDVARQVLSGAVQPSTLERVVYNAWADAYNVGTLAADVQMGKVPKGWDDWEPGMTANNKVTALGWKETLADADITLKGITDTTVNKLAYAIADGVNAGDPSDDIARALTRILGDPARAELIAHTETARMLNQSAMYQYEAAGVTQWDLITSSGACTATCLPVKDANPHNIGEGPTVPLHPRCRCAASPHLEGTPANGRK
ncbi:phage portal protein [Arthrobacter sp. ISL-69]|nr:phage portal protein [Arthrobacter sp. ISL-69]